MNSYRAKFVLCSVAVFAATLLLMVPGVSAVVRPDDSGGGSPTAPGSNSDICNEDGTRCNAFVENYINPFIYLFSAMVGVAAVISIIVAGIQYSSSADDPAAVSKAKQRIFNTVIGLVAYIFLFAFLNYLVPGGIF